MADFESIHLAIEPPGAEELARFRSGLERSGMTFGHCAECGREHGTRSGSDLCVPCREPRFYDGWKELHPETDRTLQRGRLLALLLGRGVERLLVERLGDAAAEQGDPDVLAVVERALGGDESLWGEALYLAGIYLAKGAPR